MKRIIVTADSTFDLPLSLVRAYDIKVFPSHIRMGDSYIADYPDVRQDALFEYYRRTKTLPQTAAANPSEYRAFFSKYTQDGDAVVHIAKSAGISSCYENALLATSDLSDVYVVDSMNVSGGSALLAIAAAGQRGGDAPRSLAMWLCEYRMRIDGSFIIESLEYLREGGRCKC